MKINNIQRISWRFIAVVLKEPSGLKAVVGYNEKTHNICLTRII